MSSSRSSGAFGPRAKSAEDAATLYSRNVGVPVGQRGRIERGVGALAGRGHPLESHVVGEEPHGLLTALHCDIVYLPHPPPYLHNLKAFKLL